jgi:hypothetical protein
MTEETKWWKRHYWNLDVVSQYEIPEHVLKILREKFEKREWHCVEWNHLRQLWIDGERII